MPDHTWSWVARYIDTESFPGAATDVEIAGLLRCRPQTVADCRAELGLASAPERRRRAIRRAVANEDKARPLSDVQLARVIGKPQDTARAIRRGLGIAGRVERREG
jgi:DNA-directed RNA polymerase specialized sigma54-like protein